MPPRKKLELLGMVERVHSLFHKEKKSLKDIALILKNEGITVSITAISNAVNGYESEIKELKQRTEIAKAVVQSIGENQNDSLEAAALIFQDKLLTLIQNTDITKLSDPVKIATIMESLARTRFGVIKINQAYNKGLNDAKEALKSSLQSLLMAENPDLLMALIDELEKASNELSRKT